MLESCQCPHSPLYFLNTDILGNGSVLFHLNFTQPTLLNVNQMVLNVVGFQMLPYLLHNRSLDAFSKHR